MQNRVACIQTATVVEEALNLVVEEICQPRRVEEVLHSVLEAEEGVQRVGAVLIVIKEEAL